MSCRVAVKRKWEFKPVHPGLSSCKDETNKLINVGKKRRKNVDFNQSSSEDNMVVPNDSNKIWKRFEVGNRPENTAQSSTAKSPFEAVKGHSSATELLTDILQQYRLMKNAQVLKSPSQQISSLSKDPLAAGTLLQQATDTSNMLTSDKHQPQPNVPLFTIKQVGVICEQLLRKQQNLLRDEYERTLLDKLSEQYDAFVKFNEDQLQRMFAHQAMSYVS